MCVLSFFTDAAATEVYTLSLHDALPICERQRRPRRLWGECRHRHTETGCDDRARPDDGPRGGRRRRGRRDRKSTRLNSSHSSISYAVFCLKKKKNSIHLVHPCEAALLDS